MEREAKIGLFVVIALAVMGYFVLRTSDMSSLWEKRPPKVSAVIKLNDASGIREGTSAQIAGVKVGEVTGVSLEEGYALVTLDLRAEVQLKEGAYAELRNKGVLGERYIAIYPGSGTNLEPGTPLEGKVPPSLEDITTTINGIGKDLAVITDNLKQSTLAPDGGNRLEVIAANIERLTDTLVQMAAENRGNINTTTQDIAGLAAELNKGIPSLVKELSALASDLRAAAAGNRQPLDETMNNVAALTKKIDTTSASVSEIADKVNRGEGSLGKLINESETVDNLNKVLLKAEESLGKVEALVGKASDLELNLHFRGEYLADSEANKNYFGLRIQPDPSKYYLLQGVSRDTDDLPLEFNQTTEETFDADGNLISRTVITNQEEPDDVVFTGQLAYRVGPVFLRGGVIESEGGGGFDFYSLKNKLRFSMEAWDFSRDDNLNPHGKIDISLELSKNIQFNLGWDDFLEASRDSAFLGAGIRWKDDDLKLLLSNIGKAF